jgi:hypothetical protein
MALTAAGLYDKVPLEISKRYVWDLGTGMTLLQRLLVQETSYKYSNGQPIYVQFQKVAADGDVGDTTSDAMLDAQKNYRLTSACYIPHDALVAHDENYATVALKVGATTKASFTSKITGGSGHWVDNTPVDLTVADDQINADDVVLFDIAKTGTGVAVPVGVIQAEITPGNDDTTADEVILTVQRDCKILSAEFVPSGTLTANDSNYATISLKVSTTTHASVTTETTGSGDWTADTPVALTIDSANLSDGDEIRLVIAKTGTGVFVPDGVVQLTTIER